MGIEWRKAHPAFSSWRAMDGLRHVGDVIPYRHSLLVPWGDGTRRWQQSEQFWLGFLVGERVTGECATVDEAKAAVEDAYEREAIAEADCQTS